MRPTAEGYFLAMATLASQRSTCLRAQHGSVIVKDGHVTSTGYNGSAAGLPHCTDEGVCIREAKGAKPGEQYQWCVAVHSEQNAIIQAARHGTAVKGATIYVTGCPCLLCSRMIVNAGIAEVVFAKSDRYATTEPIGLLTQAGVKVREI